MEFIILSDTYTYPYHEHIIKALVPLVSAGDSNAQIIDITDKTSLPDISRRLAATSADCILSLDLAGFELRTLTGECLLNMLPCKICNLLWGNKTEYTEYLSGKLSLSMLFYDATGKDNQLPLKYPNMRYYFTTPKAIPTAPDDAPTDSFMQLTLQDILNRFKEEVLL